MKGIRYGFSLPKVIMKKLGLSGPYSLISYRDDWPVPTIDDVNRVVVRNRLGGICGTDLHLMSLHFSYFASIIAGPGDTFPMGHECVGTVAEIGDQVSTVRVGDRVVMNPVLSCEALGFEPCRSCRDGNQESCLVLAGVGDGSSREERFGGRGKFGGQSGGGYCEYFSCMEKQLFRVPESIPDAVAVLVEPFAVGLHAVLRSPPREGDGILVLGAGTIGLMTIAALKLVYPENRITAVARYPFQAEAAKRLGADEVVFATKGDGMYDEIVSATGGTLFKPILGKRGVFGGDGPGIVYDSVATESSLDDALHLVRSNGTVVVIGMGYAVTKTIDWSIQVLKEIDIRGSIVYGAEQTERGPVHTFDLAIAFMEKNPDLFSGIVSHRFSINEYKTAFRVALNKAKNDTIKPVFVFS